MLMKEDEEPNTEALFFALLRTAFASSNLLVVDVGASTGRAGFFLDRRRPVSVGRS